MAQRDCVERIGHVKVSEGWYDRDDGAQNGGDRKGIYDGMFRCRSGKQRQQQYDAQKL